MLTGTPGLMQGFSGAPIANEESEAVIGVFTIVHTGETDNHCMIPLDDVRRFLLSTNFVDVLPPPGSGEIEDATDRRLRTELITLFTLMMKIPVDDRREFFKRLSALSPEQKQALISAYAQEDMPARCRDAALQSPAELQFIFALLKDRLPAAHRPQALHGSWLVLRDLIHLKHERLRIGALRATHGLPSLLEALSQTLTMLLAQSPKEALQCETARAAVEAIVWLSELILRRPLAEESTKQLRCWLTDAYQLAERCDGGRWPQEVLLILSQLYTALGRYDDALSCIEPVLANQDARTSIDQALRALSQQPAKSADVLARAQGLLTKYTAARTQGELNPRLLQAIAGLALTLADVLASDGRAKFADDLYIASREVFAELDDRQGEGQCWLGLALNNAPQEAARPVASFLNRARALFYVCGDELGRARTVTAALDLRGIEELHHVMVLECQELIARLEHVPDAAYKQIATEARISLVSWLLHRAESLGSTTESHPFLNKATEHLEKLAGETEFLRQHPALAAACLQLQAEVLALEESWPPLLATTEELLTHASISGAARQRAHSLRARAYLAIAKSEGSRSPEQLLEIYFNALQEMAHSDSADWQMGRLRAGEVLLDKCDAIADARALARAGTLPEVLTALKISMERLGGAQHRPQAPSKAD